MLISTESFLKTAREVAASDKVTTVSIDFETNGLFARRGDRAFLLGVCVDDACFSYRFKGSYEEKQALEALLSNERIRYLAHNAKFEMSFLKEQWGVEIKGDVWDTEVMARVEHNNHRSYSLQACAERIGESKHRPMLEWLKANSGKYAEAPDDLIIPYVEQDARLSYKLYKDQCDTFRAWENSSACISGVVGLEMATTKHLFDMESAGIHVDVLYCLEALDYELARAEAAKKEFEKLVGAPFVDSRKALTPIFDSLNIPYNKTEKGNASFDYEALKKSKNHPVVAEILKHRDAVKRSSTYWENFLALNIGGVVYPNIRQGGAASGRFSCVEPNAQNWPDDSEDPTCRYPVRRAFIAPHECDLVSMDYAQMELRLIVDESNETEMIHDIINGVDFHQKVAESANVPRGIAKAARFAKLYGAGVRKIAQMLSVSEDVAARVCEEIDRSSPNISRYSYGLIKTAKTAPFVYNWLGRRYYFDKGFEYKYPNYCIQGGSADILRVAIKNVSLFLRKHAHPMTRILLPIHDELITSIDHRDLHLIPEIRQIMIEAAVPMKHLKMDVSIAKGKNLHDMEEYTN